MKCYVNFKNVQFFGGKIQLVYCNYFLILLSDKLKACGFLVPMFIECLGWNASTGGFI